MNKVWDYIKDAECIIDIGANTGREVDAFLTAFPKAEIYMFEPHPDLYKILVNKYDGNDRCQIYDVAISNVIGCRTFYLNGIHRDSSSLKKPTELIKETRCFEDVASVKTITLDMWAKINNTQHVDLIWADVQGNEKEMILGAKETLKVTKYLYTEYNQLEYYDGITYLDEIISLLHRDFEIEEIFPSKNHCGDILFKNRKELLC